MNKAVPLMIQGTASDVGKSVLVTAFCRIFAQQGYKTAPFKSQNMSLNSYITFDGKEIGRAQGVQAEAAGSIATTDMNPILLKPTRSNESQVVIHGTPYHNLSGIQYRSDFFAKGLEIIEKAYTNLASTFDRIVIEGAGSPAEVNLNDRELVNMRVAKIADAPVILVTDIERGGAFASLVGTLQLLSDEDRARVMGVIINKFHGDIQLLQSGLEWFEEYTNIPVLGVIPFVQNLHIDAEDSLILNSYPTKNENEKDIDIAVIQYPKISNFTDIDPFLFEEDCQIRMVQHPRELGKPDMIVLPGSKNTIEDLLFLREVGLEERIKSLCHTQKTVLFGICGGYQMLGGHIFDPFEIESPYKQVEGLCMLPIETTLGKTKTTTLSKGHIRYGEEGIEVHGYEIHMGQSKHLDDSCRSFIDLGERTEGTYDENKRVIGTYFHSIFHNDRFRTALLNQIRKEKGLEPITNRVSFVTIRERGFNLLAEHVRRHVNLDLIDKQMTHFNYHKTLILKDRYRCLK